MSSSPGSFSKRYCGFVSRHAGAILFAALLLFAGALFLASKLQLKTAFSELLPSDDPGVVALERTQKRIGDMSLLLVGVHSPDREANLRYAEHLTKKLLELPKNTIALATYHVRDLRGFFEKNKWLYLAENDLVSIRDRLRSEISRRKNPLLVDLSDDDAESVEQMRDRLTKEDRLGGRFPDGVFSNADGSYVWIAALPPGGIFGERGGEGIFEAATRLVRENDPRAFHPEMVAHVGGPVATAVASRAAVENDILWVTVSCLVIVGISIALFFRRLRSLPLIASSAVMGTIMAFAVAELAFGYVNSSTAFLGSIILGNGINYAIILMSRYEEHRAQGDGTMAAMERAIAGVARGTWVAAVCASASYATLMLTKFRGFYQFGLMAAFGVLFCWALTFAVLPSLFFLLDRRSSAKTRASTRPPLNFAVLGRWVEKHMRGLALASIALTLCCGFGLLHFVSAPFEYDFRKLNTNLHRTEQAEQFHSSIDKLFGRWPSPTVVVADTHEEVESIRAAIWRQSQADPVIGQVVTIDNVLPGTPEVQRRKLALLKEIRKLKQDPALEVLKETEKKQLASLDLPEDARVLVASDLPPLAQRPFTEADGTVGRVLLIYPAEKTLSVWNGKDLLRIANVLEYLHLDKENKTITTSGSAVVFAAMIRSVLHDGPLATVASFLVVLLFSLLIMRPRSAALFAIATLVVGVVWMVGCAGLAEVKITFLNFIALPITFGIGVEYGLNVAQRYREERNMPLAVGSTGAAVALCSWTTIVGYGSLLAANNRALRGFGMMAILGEVACLAAALLALPAIILWRERRRQQHS